MNEVPLHCSVRCYLGCSYLGCSLFRVFSYLGCSYLYFAHKLFYITMLPGGGPFGRRRLGARHLVADSFFFDLWRKNNKAGNSLNAVECEPVPTRVLNLNASEATNKPKQRSLRKTNLKHKTWRPIVQVPKCPAPKRRRPNVPDPCLPPYKIYIQ